MCKNMRSLHNYFYRLVALTQTTKVLCQCLLHGKLDLNHVRHSHHTQSSLEQGLLQTKEDCLKTTLVHQKKDQERISFTIVFELRI